ncbi:MAG: hypothetical protein HY268_13220 [Deltaproteobacteria bacterium]|nr:hypothetical protein [Deltaproteobacteria bacterium]
MRQMLLVLGLVVLLGIGEARAQEKNSPGQNMVGADVQVKAAIAKGKNPSSPPANASKKTTIGKGKTVVNTANAPGDDDSFWVESIDIDGDGTVEETDVLYDDEDKVVYLHADGDFKCKGGGTGAGDMLIAVNTAGNSRNRPAGSGWYVVDLDESECKAKIAGLYGCKFDANGNATACGMATLDEKNDEIVIAEAAM